MEILVKEGYVAMVVNYSDHPSSTMIFNVGGFYGQISRRRGIFSRKE